MNQIPTTHVTSLELSRRLKELGVQKESIFHWVNSVVNDPGDCYITNKPKESFDAAEYIPAYLASEIGEILPSDIKLPITYERCYFLTIEKTGYGKFRKYYVCYEGSSIPHSVAQTLPEAMGLMLAYLLENHLISVEELGK